MHIDKISDTELDEFSPTDDGFRSVESDAPVVDATDANVEETTLSHGVTLDKVDVLISQHGATVDSELGLAVVNADNLADVGFNIKSVTMPFVLQFSDIRILREFIRRHGMFGVKIAALTNIPDVVKDRLYEQSVWDMNAVDYPVLLDRVRTVADSDAAKRRKDEVQKRRDRREVQRVTAETDDVSGFTHAKANPDDDDGEQFGGDDA